MRILEVVQPKTQNSIYLRALVGEPEFRHLKGNLDRICLFATDTIDQDVTVTKTGARHSFAKWLLLPARLRTDFNGKKFDYKAVKAGLVEYKDCVFFIYRVNSDLAPEKWTRG